MCVCVCVCVCVYHTWKKIQQRGNKKIHLQIFLWLYIVLGNFKSFCRFASFLTPYDGNQLPGCHFSSYDIYTYLSISIHLSLYQQNLFIWLIYRKEKIVLSTSSLLNYCISLSYFCPGHCWKKWRKNRKYSYKQK